MDAVKFQSNWTKFQPQIKQKWSKLSEEDLKQINGKVDVFFSKVQAKYGLNKEQVIRELASFETSGIKSNTQTCPKCHKPYEASTAKPGSQTCPACQGSFGKGQNNPQQNKR